MGQYYQIQIVAPESQDRNVTLIKPSHFDDGLKLMEFAYTHSDTSKALFQVIEKYNGESVRVATVGDYAEVGDVEASFEGFTDPMGLSIGKAGIRLSVVCDNLHLDGLYHREFPKLGWSRHRTVINEDRGEYIVIDLWDKEALNPLFLLTALGNGRGGGDYAGTCEELIGKWAYNSLRVIEGEYKDAGGKMHRLDCEFEER